MKVAHTQKENQLNESIRKVVHFDCCCSNSLWRRTSSGRKVKLFCRRVAMLISHKKNLGNDVCMQSVIKGKLCTFFSKMCSNIWDAWIYLKSSFPFFSSLLCKSIWWSSKFRKLSIMMYECKYIHRYVPKAFVVHAL